LLELCWWKAAFWTSISRHPIHVNSVPGTNTARFHARLCCLLGYSTIGHASSKLWNVLSVSASWSTLHGWSLALVFLSTASLNDDDCVTRSPILQNDPIWHGTPSLHFARRLESAVTQPWLFALWMLQGVLRIPFTRDLPFVLSEFCIFSDLLTNL
jgi:hypothetical protein